LVYKAYLWSTTYGAQPIVALGIKLCERHGGPLLYQFVQSHAACPCEVLEPLASRMNSAARYSARVKMTHNERLPPPPPLGADVTVVLTATVLLVLTGSVADVMIEAVAV
jgi:hypothetical protein